MYKPEHPRPDRFRPRWLNLNGEWQFTIDSGCSGKERKLHERGIFTGKIEVPFVPESKLSGIGYQDFIKSVWYRREIEIPADWQGGRVLLHFGAVDYLAEVWVNGVSAGTHKGGYTPFVFDISVLLNSDKNILTVNTYDDVLDPMQPSGKQCDRYYNHGCHYTRCTGIWQTVWLEWVPELYITDFKLTPDVDNGRLFISAALNQYAGGQMFTAVASLDGEFSAECVAIATGKTVSAVLDLPGAKLWNPSAAAGTGAPVLYDLKLKIGDDEVATYFGMRKIEINGFAIEINGRPVFQRLVLDQGYYPDGIYTAKDDEEIKRDIVLAMEAGFNGARMHMKVFEPRYLYWADRLGYMVWGEYPNWGLDERDERALLHMLPEWIEAVKRDYNHPAVVGWCPFNETRPERAADIFKSVYQTTRLYDAMRPIIDTSGYVHAVTDIYDVHDYEQNIDIFRERYAKVADGSHIWLNRPDIEKYEGQPYFVSEFGGPWRNIDGGEDGWGYGQAPRDEEEFYARYQGWVDALLDNPRICAFCFTQITDVMQEKNGMYTFRREPKYDMARVRAINEKKAAVEKE
ncbi:MAG: beta-galactosidase [Oscillospiraceae bacterium]|nr:beta-galactosidase [Oscillospiraceae bacterium]